MPFLWRYLLKRYLSVCISVAVGASIGLILLRLDDIAHIASLGAEPKDILFFTLYQIPYLFPIILPVACMLSAFLLIREMRDKHQLTSLRASGISLWNVLKPVLIASLFLSLFNGYILSEVSTRAHLQTHLLKKRLRSINPLQLVHNRKLLRLHGAFYETLGPHQVGRFAEKAVFALPSDTGMRLLLADRLEFEKGSLQAKDASFLFAGKEGRFRGVENTQSFIFSSEDFAGYFKEKAWKTENDHLAFNDLLSGLKGASDSKKWNAFLSELIRRFFLTFLAFFFTLLGATTTLSLGRKISYIGSSLLFLNVGYFLFTYFLGEALASKWPLYLSLSLSCYVFMTLTSLWCYRRFEQGKVV